MGWVVRLIEMATDEPARSVDVLEFGHSHDFTTASTSMSIVASNTWTNGQVYSGTWVQVAGLLTFQRLCCRKAATLVALCTVVGACAPLPIVSAAGQLQEFDLNCSTHRVREDPLSRPPTNWRRYHIDLSKGLVNYSDPLSTATPIQLAWTSDYEGHTYRIAINRMTGALYEMQFNSSGQRTGYDTSGTCELAPPPAPQPKF